MGGVGEQVWAKATPLEESLDHFRGSFARLSCPGMRCCSHSGERRDCAGESTKLTVEDVGAEH